MDAKIITGLLLWFCLMASISISQSASARLDSRLRLRRQNDETTSSATIAAQSTESTGTENDGANVPQATTDAAETTLPQVSILDREALSTDAADTTANEIDSAVTTAQSNTAAPETVTAILADGTTIVLPPGTTVTIVAEESTTDATAATETVEPDATGIVVDGTTIGAATVEAVTDDETSTAGVTDLETSTILVVDNGTDIFTTVEPGNGHGDADASNDTTSTADGTTSAEGVSDQSSTFETVTVDTNVTTLADNETVTQTTDVTGAETNVTSTIEPGENDDVYDDGNEEDKQSQDKTVVPGNDNNEEDDAVQDDDAKVTTTTKKTTQRAANGPTEGSDDVEYYDVDEEEDETGPKVPSAPNAENAPVQPGSGDRVELRVVVNPEVLQVQRGQTVELTCTVFGGDGSTNIFWIQEEPERRYAVLDPANDNDRQVAASQVSLRARITLDDPSKIGKYTCTAQGSAGNSGSAVLNMQEGGGGGGGYYPQPVYPGVAPAPGPGAGRGYLRIVAPDMTEGDYVEIQCEGAAPEDEGNIQWYFNNQLIEVPLVNEAQPLYPRGKTLYIRPISRAYLGNYRCSVPASGYTDANSVLTFGGSAPSQPVQPSYVVPAPTSQPVSGQCNADEATCRNGRCIPHSYRCDGKNDCGDNSDEACGPPGGSGADGCQPNEIRCSNPDRGRKCVQKFWMCDGDRDCDDGSDEEQRYCELLPRQRYCKTSEFQCTGRNSSSANPVCIPRSFQCDGYNDCPDRSDEIGCVKPTITSPPQRQIQVNAGQTLTIQCTARGAPAPYINWRLNWGFICGDGSDNGRCQITQSLDPNDPTLVTGTVTVLNVNANDGGAYSCEALNNQGFIFAVPDAIVNVVIVQGPPVARPACNCNGHSSYCSSDGRCLSCQHNTAGANCEYCASGYQGDARRGTPYDCQPNPVVLTQRCDPSGTHMERGGRCVCKYNVEGDRCDQCKRSHYYLNPTTPNGCLPCFCSGVSSDCTSSDWRRQAVSLPLNNWNAVPRNFATDRYEARDRIQQRNGGREIALDQNSLGRPANEVLYWKAPKEVLGDVVTLYDGNIDVHFTNDGNDGGASNDNEFLWLRGNNIDLVHKIPQSQQFQANSDATYSVPCNERTFTRKDGTYIDRENILMALSDLDTFLVKINPLGGRRNAVLRGVTLNVAARDGSADTALTVESCRCPANYTGTSCEKCAEGYGRPHPLVGIYLGQCWSCRSLCHEHADRCDRETGKCFDCQGNTEGDRCERCRAGYTLNPQSNQCLPDGQYQPYPSQPSYGTGSRGTFYINQRPYDPSGQAPSNVVLDGSQPEQRISFQVTSAQPQSIVWGRADGNSLPANVVQEGNDLVFRNPSSEQGGSYIATVTHPDGSTERVAVYVDYRPGQQQPAGVPSYGYPVFSPASPLAIAEGSTQLIQPPSGYYQARWKTADGQPFPSGVYQSGDGLQINGARPDQSGTYYCELYGPDGTSTAIPYEVRVQGSQRPQPVGAPPKVSIEPRVINLKEGQRMIVQYSVASTEPINVVWNKLTDQGYQPIPSLFTVEPNRLVLNRATPEAAGTYQVIVRSSHGEDRQELTINVEPRRTRGRGQQAGAPKISFPQEQYEVGYGENFNIVPNIYGASGATITWSKDGSTTLPNGVTALNDGTLAVQGQSSDIDGRYNLDVTNAQGRTSSQIFIRWREASRGPVADQANRYPKVQWNVRNYDLAEGRRLEAVCRTDVDPSTLRLYITRSNSRTSESAPLGLSFSNGYLSLGAVTRQDNGLQFICSSGDVSDILTLTVRSTSDDQDRSRSFAQVRLESRDEQSHQIGRDIHLQCSVQGNVERPHEYTYTKDGQPLENNVEVHPEGLLIIRNAQANDAGRYRCEVNFPRAPEVGTQESNYDLRIEGGSAGNQAQGSQYAGEGQQQGEYVEVTVEPTEVTIGRGEKATLTCHVKGAQQYTVTWGKYAHDTSLPSYARQQGNSVIITPTNDLPAEQLYFQCQVDVPGHAQAHHAYAPVTIRGGDESTIIRKPRLLIEPSTHIRISRGDKLHIRCFDPYDTSSTTISWFRKKLTLIIIPNQHSNGILDFHSISDADIGQYVCRGQNRGGFTEEIVTLEYSGSAPSITISPNMTNRYLQVPLHSTQAIECLSQDNTTLLDITWRRSDTGDLNLSKTSTLFPSNMPLEFEHNGMYTCIARNEFGSTSESITLNVQQITNEISIDIEPMNIFPIDSEINFNCKLPQSRIIRWSSINHGRRENNPLRLRIGLNHINKRFICHAKDINGKWHRKVVRIQRYSQEQLRAVIINNEIERNLQQNQRKIKPSKMNIKLITPPHDIKTGGTVELHCYIEGLIFNKFSWLFQSGLLPSNAHVTDDGHLLIYNFDRSNLGSYTCLAETPTERLSQSINFQPSDILDPIKPFLSFQIYSSRSDYRFGGRLVIECISSDPKASKLWIKQQGILTQNISEQFLFINKLNQKHLARYQCLSSDDDKPSSINFDINRSNLHSHRFSYEINSNLRIEFQSSIHQFKLGGNILINCSSSDKTPVRWLLNKQINGLVINNSYLHISKFSNNHFGYYQCVNDNTEKTLVLSPTLFELVKNFNLPKVDLVKYNKSSIEMIRGKYIGDNITLICQIGRDVSQGKVVWSNLPLRTKQFYIRGPRLEFRPFELEHHNQYKCLIKSKQSNEVLRTLTFNSYSNIYEKIDRKPNMNLTIDTSRLFSNDELRLVCTTDGLNKDYQWTFDDQIPRSKIHYELTMSNHTSIMIIPDFDLEVDSGKYECLTKNSFGTTIRNINIDKKALKSKRKRQG